MAKKIIRRFKVLSLPSNPRPDSIYYLKVGINAIEEYVTDSNGNYLGETNTLDADKHYEYVKNLPSASWSIAHNLNKYPSVTVVDTSGSEVVGEVQHISENNLLITFSAAFAGKAYLN